MFLALNELFKERARFILIILVIVLISYLTFFLTALAYGLATSYTQGIDKWYSGGIILQKDANDNIARSLITKADYETVLDDSTALLGVSNSAIEINESEDVSIFGLDIASFISPNITEGKAMNADDEIVVSDQLESAGIKLGQRISIKGIEKDYLVVGFTDRATFQTTPIIYMNLTAWRAAASELSGMIGMKDETTVSAIVTKEPAFNKIISNKLAWQTIKDFSFKLPGYYAQVLTFGTMIGFLILISSFVLAIFMYILTLQKKSIFGVLKAEGIPSSYIARSVLVQAVLLTGFGMTLGLGLTLASGIAAGEVIPFMVQPLFFAAIAGLFLLCAVIGGVASVKAVTKIDPVEAIG